MLLTRAIIFGAAFVLALAALLAVVLSHSAEDFDRVNPYEKSRCVIFNMSLEKNLDGDSRVLFNVSNNFRLLIEFTFVATW